MSVQTAMNIQDQIDRFKAAIVPLRSELVNDAHTIGQHGVSTGLAVQPESGLPLIIGADHPTKAGEVDVGSTELLMHSGYDLEVQQRAEWMEAVIYRAARLPREVTPLPLTRELFAPETSEEMFPDRGEEMLCIGCSGEATGGMQLRRGIVSTFEPDLNMFYVDMIAPEGISGAPVWSAETGLFYGTAQRVPSFTRTNPDGSKYEAQSGLVGAKVVAELPALCGRIAETHAR
jgi:hypothetical protein